jgi:hypothetical protein
MIAAYHYLLVFAVDAWAKSGEGGAAATRAEAILQHMNQLYQSGGHDSLRPTTGIFNAVINAWARSREKIAPVRAEQILEWMDKLHKTNKMDIQPDKYTFNTGTFSSLVEGSSLIPFSRKCSFPLYLISHPCLGKVRGDRSCHESSTAPGSHA